MFYTELFGTLEKHGVRYAVVGGLAVNLLDPLRESTSSLLRSTMPRE